MMKALSIIATTIACLIYALASVSAPAAEPDAYGETRVPFGGEIEGAGQQGERRHPLRKGVRIAESPVAPIHLS